MDVKSKFLELKKAWKNAKGSERENVEKELDAFMKSLSDAEKKELTEAIDADFAQMHEDIEEIKSVMDVREILLPVLPSISVSYIAKRYFGKTRSWLTQRINGNTVNGKSAKFTEAEKELLRGAMQDVAKTLNSAAVSL